MLIVRVPRDAPVMARIRAELEASEYSVREIGPDMASVAKPLSELASSVRARAVVRMQPQRHAVELWVAGDGDAAGSGEVVSVDALDKRAPSGTRRASELQGRDAALLALRATEALRARGLRLQRAEPTPPPPGRAAREGAGVVPSGAGRGAEPKPTEVVTGGDERASAPAAGDAASAESPALSPIAQLPAPERPTATPARPPPSAANVTPQTQRAEEARAEPSSASEAEEDEPEPEPEEPEPPAAPIVPALVSVELGPGLATSISQITPQVAVWANIRVRPRRLWSIDAFGLVPFAGGNVGSAEQSATVRNFIGGGALDLHWPLARFELSVGAGAAFVITSAGADRISTPNRRNDEDGPQLTGSVLARGAAHLVLSEQVRVGARIAIGVSIPELDVRFSGQSVSHWGLPYFIASLGVELGFGQIAQ